MKLVLKVIIDIERKNLPKKKIEQTAAKVFTSEGKNEGSVNIILTNDKNIKKLNKKYLSHNFATDVISFLIEEDEFIGEIYISVDTASVQAKEYNVSLTNELLRLTAHGALHLCGYDDSDVEKRNKMSKLEDLFI